VSRVVGALLACVCNIVTPEYITNSLDLEVIAVLPEFPQEFVMLLSPCMSRFEPKIGASLCGDGPYATQLQKESALKAKHEAMGRLSGLQANRRLEKWMSVLDEHRW